MDYIENGDEEDNVLILDWKNPDDAAAIDKAEFVGDNDFIVEDIEIETAEMEIDPKADKRILCDDCKDDSIEATTNCEECDKLTSNLK